MGNKIGPVKYVRVSPVVACAKMDLPSTSHASDKIASKVGVSDTKASGRKNSPKSAFKVQLSTECGAVGKVGGIGTKTATSD